MPYAKRSMEDLLKENRFKDINFTYQIFYKLGLAIQYLHKQEADGEKCYHRDLKHRNVLFMENKENKEPLLADLGLAHINPKFAVFEVNSLRELRNPYYCAPEQIFGNAGMLTIERTFMLSALCFGKHLQVNIHVGRMHLFQVKNWL